MNIKGNGVESHWKEMFTIIIWQIWKWLNNFIFNGSDMQAKEKISQVQKLKEEFFCGFQQGSHGLETSRDYINTMVNWRAPQKEWSSINIDDCFKNVGETCAGAVERDFEGKRSVSINFKIHVLNAAEVECHALLEYLRCARSRDQIKVLVYSDSEMTIKWIKEDIVAEE